MRHHQLFRFKPDDYIGKLQFLINQSKKVSPLNITTTQLSKVRDGNRTTNERLEYLESLVRGKSSLLLDAIAELDEQVRRYDVILTYVDDKEAEKHIRLLKLELSLRRDNIQRSIKYGLNYLTPDQMSQLDKVKTDSDSTITDRAELLGHLHLQRLTTAEKDAN